MSPLDWEKHWIDTHPEYYSGISHMSAVKSNIEHRYRRNAIVAKLKSLRPAFLKNK